VLGFDRVVDVRPVIAPCVFINEERLSMVDAINLPAYRDRMVCAWNPSWDKEELLFGDAVGGDLVVVQIRNPIEIPSSPTEVVKLPQSYHEYLLLFLAVTYGVKLGLTESVDGLKASLALETKRITQNNNYQRPVFLHANIDRFV
jgi:hypothetical protein